MLSHAYSSAAFTVWVSDLEDTPEQGELVFRL